jgi:hypothetical protein
MLASYGVRSSIECRSAGWPWPDSILCVGVQAGSKHHVSVHWATRFQRVPQVRNSRLRTTKVRPSAYARDDHARSGDSFLARYLSSAARRIDRRLTGHSRSLIGSSPACAALVCVGSDSAVGVFRRPSACAGVARQSHTRDVRQFTRLMLCKGATTLRAKHLQKAPSSICIELR